MDTSDSTIPLKRCTKCGRDLPATHVHFTRRAKNIDGLYHICKECDGRSFGNRDPLPAKDGYKRCTICLVELPATTEYFYKSNKTKCGLYNVCKKCKGGDYGIHRTFVVTDGEFKYCTKCGARHPATLEYFGKDKYTPDGLKRNCRQCVRQYANRYYEIHSDKLSETSRNWHAKHRERNRANGRHWRRNNPSKVRATKLRYRARKRALPDTFTAQHERTALEYFNHCCAACGRQLKDLFATHTAAFDHWIPLSRGGGSTPDNLVPLCHGVDGCNNSKGNNDPAEWLERKFGKRKAKRILERIEAYFASIRE